MDTNTVSGTGTNHGKVVGAELLLINSVLQALQLCVIRRGIFVQYRSRLWDTTRGGAERVLPPPPPPPFSFPV